MKKYWKSISPFVFCLLVSLGCGAQKVSTFQQIFGGTGDEAGCSILQLKDKGFLMASTTKSFGAGGMDILMIRMDSLGKIIWSKTYGGKLDEGLPSFYLTWDADLIQTPDSNFVLCTNTQSYGDGGRDVYLIKIDINGNVLWDHTYGGTSDDAGNIVINDPKGGLMIVGETASYGNGNLDVMLLKTDDSGKVLWANAYGSSKEERGYKVYPSYDKGYLVCGVSNNGSNQYDWLVMKVDSTGKLLWSKVFGGNGYDIPLDIIELPSKKIYVAGFSTNSGSQVAQLTELDQSGNLKWTRSIGDKALKNITYDAANNVFNIECFVTVSGYQNIGLVRMDTAGNPKFLKYYGPTSSGGYSVGQGHGLAQLSSGGFIMTTTDEKAFGFGGYDIYMMKMDANGNTNSCNTNSLTRTTSNYAVSDHSYTFTTKSFTPTVGNGVTTSSWTIKDSLFCEPFIANFRWQNKCAGQAVDFYDSSYYKATSWKWNFGDAYSSTTLNKSTSKNPTHIYSKSGTYTVKLVSSNGADTDSLTNTVIVYPSPAHLNSTTVGFCVGDSLDFKAFGTGAKTFAWSPAGFVSDSTDSTTWAYPYQNGIFIVKATNTYGCTEPDSFTAKLDSSCALPTSIGGVINNYAAVSAYDSCYNYLTVDTASFFKVGDTALLIEMKGATIDTSDTSTFGTIKSIGNAGNYEYVTVESVSGNEVYLKNSLLKRYDPRGLVQLVTVPQYGNVLVSKTLAAQPWNGTKGGVLAFKSSGNIYLAADIDASGKGFGGGTDLAGSASKGSCHGGAYYYASTSTFAGAKGEGIAAIDLARYAGRGANANGGGGGDNALSGGAGGGGYANGGAGGIETSSSCTSPVTNGGIGGTGLGTYIKQNRVFLGGGGGAGAGVVPSAPEIANGGGIVLVQARELVSGGFAIKANGDDQNTSARPTIGNGGGGGGTVVANIGYLPVKLQVQANGGSGENIDVSPCNGPGGGGGGGALLLASATVPSNLSFSAKGGASGLDQSTTATCYNTGNGASGGTTGGTVKSVSVPEDTTTFITPSVKITTLGQYICYGDSLKLTATVQGIKSLKWSPAATVRNPASATTYVYPATPTTYKLTATTNAGCLLYDSVTINVWPAKPPTPVITLATVTKNPDVQLTVSLNSLTNVASVTVYVSVDGGAYTKLSTIAKPAKSFSVTDSPLATTKHRYVYVAIATDSCGTVGDSSVKTGPALLQGIAGDLQDVLDWENYTGYNADTIVLQRLTSGSGSWANIATPTYLSTTYTDKSYMRCGIPQSYRLLTYVKGQTSLSDTITLTPFDTVSPALVDIISASVTSGTNIALTFDKTAKKTVREYLVYVKKDSGTYVLADSVLAKKVTGPSYTYNYKVNTLSDTFGFEVFALDSCGNVSRTSEMHRAVQLNGKALDDSASLSWSNYLGFTVKDYVVQEWSQAKGWADYKTLPSTDSTFTEVEHCGAVLNFRIKAVENGGAAATAYSDSIQITPFDTIPPPQDSMRSVSVLNSSHIAVTFNKDAAPDVIGYVVYRSKNGGAFADIDTVKRPTGGPITFTDNVNALTDTFSYKVYAFDSCGNVSQTAQIHRAVQLNGSPLDDSSYLSWSAYEGFTVKSYTVQTSEKGSGWADAYTGILPTTTAFIAPGSCRDTFYYRIKALENGGAGSVVYSDSTAVVPFDTVPPARDSMLSVSVLNGSHIPVTFDKVPDMDVIGYYVYRSKNGGTYTKVGTVNRPASAPVTFTDNVNALSDTFSYEVFAFDSCGNVSKTAQTHRAVQLNGSPLDDSSYLSWSAYEGFMVKNYTVQAWKKGTGWTDTYTGILPTTTAFVAPGSCRDTFYYRIKALENGGAASVVYSDSTAVVPFDTVPPARDSMLSVSVLNGTHIAVTFDKVPDVDVIGYYVYRSKNGGTYTKVGTVNRPASAPVTFTDNVNALSDTFSYEVFAFDSCGNVSKTAQAHRAVQLNGSPLDDSSFLSWSAYEGFTVKNYTVQAWKKGTGWTDAYTGILPTTTAFIAPGSCNDTFYYRIKALENGGTNATVYSDSTVVVPFDTIRPSEPAITYVTVLSNSSAEVNWVKSASNDVKNYNVYRDGVQIASLGNVTTYNDTGLNTDLSHCYAVQAQDSCAGNLSGRSPPHCTVALATTVKGCEPSIYLSWNGYSGWASVERYAIYRSVNGGPEALLDTEGGTATSFRDSLLDYHDKYCYRILALDGSESDSSWGNQSCNNVFFVDTPAIVTATKTVTSTANGTVVIRWKSINTPHLAFNRLFYSSDGKTFSLLKDSIPADVDSFAHTGTNTQSADQYYYIVTVDSCGTPSDTSAVHKTMTLTVSVGELLHILNWTPYKGFAVREYYIEKLDSNVFEVIDSTATDTAARYFPAPCNSVERYRIVAVGFAAGELSLSDTMGKQAIDTIPSDAPVVQNATVLSGTSTKVAFIGSDSADTYDFVVQRATDGNWATAGSILFTTPGKALAYIDNGLNTQTHRYCYTIIARDSCLNATPSDTFCLVQLKGDSLNLGDSLNWSMFQGYGIKNYAVLLYNTTASAWDTLAKVNGGDTAYLHSPLPCNVPQTYKIEGFENGGAYTTFSDSVTLIPFDTVRPPAPIIKYATVLNDSQIELYWGKSVPKVKLYELSIKTGHGAWHVTDTVNVDTSFIFNKLNTPDSVYDFEVTAIDSCAMNRSLPGVFHSPVQLGGKDQNLSNLLTWKPYQGWDSVEKYYIYQFSNAAPGGTWTLIDSVSGDDTSYLQTGLPCDVTQAYKVAALDSGGIFLSYSDTVQLTPYDTIRPPAPIIKYATVLNDSQIELYWGKSSSNVKLYELNLKTGNGVWHVTDTVNVDTSFIFNKLNTPDSVYGFEVTAIDSCAMNRSLPGVFHSPVQLGGIHENLANLLAWKPYLGWDSVEKYYVYQLRNGTWTLIDSVVGNDTTYLQTGLPCDVTQAYKVAALDSGGIFLSYSDTVQLTPYDTIRPPAPIIKYATVLNDSQIELFWGKSSPNVKLYELNLKTGNGAWMAVDTVNGDTSFIFNKLNTPDSVYDFEVTAIDSCAMNRSLPGVFHSPVQLGGKDQNLANLLTWKPYQGWDSVEKYYVYQLKNTAPDGTGGRWTLIDSVSGSDTSYLQTGLPCDVTQAYKIAALDSGDVFLSYSDTVQLTPYDTIRPPAPIIKYATVLNDSQVELYWGKSSSNVKQYELNVKTGNGTWTAVDTIYLDTSFIFNKLNTPDSVYDFEVTAIDSCAMNRSLPGVFHSPVRLVGTPLDDTVKLDWKPYQGWDSVLYYYIYQYTPAGWTVLDHVSGNKSSYTTNTLPCNVAQAYRIEALDNTGAYLTLSDSVQVMPFDTINPPAPVLYHATVLADQTVKLSWQWDTASDTKYFEVWRVADRGVPVLVNTVIRDSVFVDTNADVRDTVYAYNVIAIDSCGAANRSAPSNTDTLMQISLHTGYCTPEVKIAWTAYTGLGINAYTVYRSVGGGTFAPIGGTKPPQLSFTDTSVKVGTQYFYVVEAAGGGSFSDTMGIVPSIVPLADSAQVIVATVTRSGTNDGAILLKWRRDGRNDTSSRGYRIYGYNTATGKYVLLKDQGNLDDTTYTDANTNTLNAVHSYYVVTYNVCGRGIPSEVHSPVLLTVANGDLNAQLAWTSYKGIGVESYNIYLSVSGAQAFLLANTADTALADSNLHCGYSYTFLVQAVLANGISSLSDSVTVQGYDTVRPRTQAIQVATVVQTGQANGQVLLSWNKAIDNNMEGYNIYRSTDGLGWALVKTDSLSTSFLDSGLNTYDRPYYYRIQPFDSCGNLGDFAPLHETVNLKATAEDGYDQLGWNAYQGWKVKRYLVLRNGKQVAETGGDTVAYRDTLAYCDSTYQYQVVAVCDTTTDTLVSLSNTDSARAFNHIPPGRVYLKAVSVAEPNKAVSITWGPSPTWDVTGYNIYRKYAVDGSMRLVGATADTTFTDSSEAVAHPDCYYVFAHDGCGNTSDGSNEGCIIVLAAKDAQDSNDLGWNPYQQWPDGVQAYNVYKNEDNQGWTLIGTTTSGSVNDFTDPHLGDTAEDFCYQVEAIESPGTHNQASRSTVECVHQGATVFVPNSFTPYNGDGVNDRFGPVGIHIKNYSMQIYNRWGERVYGTSSGQAWDGSFKGQPVPQGIYIYYITVTDFNGRVTRFKGNITMFE